MAGKVTHQAWTFLPKCLLSNPPPTPSQGPSRPWGTPVLTTPGTRHPPPLGPECQIPPEGGLGRWTLALWGRHALLPRGPMGTQATSGMSRTWSTELASKGEDGDPMEVAQPQDPPGQVSPPSLWAFRELWTTKAVLDSHLLPYY